MKWTYILIVLVIAALVSGCVDKKQAQTTVTPAPTVSPQGESSEDIFGTESNLSALDTSFNDMNMEISLVDSI